jgi:hypothetical protein
MGTQGVHLKGAHSWLVRWPSRAGTIDFCHALAALVSSAKYFTPHYTLFQLIVPVAQQARQAVVLGRLSIIYVYGRHTGQVNWWITYIYSLNDFLTLLTTSVFHPAVKCR